MTLLVDDTYMSDGDVLLQFSSVLVAQYKVTLILWVLYTAMTSYSPDFLDLADGSLIFSERYVVIRTLTMYF